ncbi:MAG: hypothetical protein K9N46_11895 [Candidatus Marinimicrobia bacterium]|nr:hypothetical protein [Candidatus Neomarinimicrobiota bacterium]MCF7827336.1 hypothetical protein [Candidatus Neomarinimicrobiota bacterium]MCF7881431.1 hypothetical protein [Candidatus Neomarinimicrobiota bacterium]
MNFELENIQRPIFRCDSGSQNENGEVVGSHRFSGFFREKKKLLVVSGWWFVVGVF